MAKKKRERGQVKGWVLEARKAGKKKAKDISAYIKENHQQDVGIQQIYGILSTAKAKKMKRTQASKAPVTGTVPANGKQMVDLMKQVKAFAEKAGGMNQLIEIAQLMK